MEQNSNPGYNSFPGEDNIDMKRYLSLFLSNWYWFAVSLFISMALAYSINRYSQRVYNVSSTLLIKDDQLASVSSNIESVIPGGDIFRNKQNLRNEMAILKSFSLNHRVMNELQDFHVVYVGLGRRGIVERLLYRSCPFRVLYDSLEVQPQNKVEIEILSENKYRIKIDNTLNIDRVLNFGERFNEKGFDFIIVPRLKGQDIHESGSSNRYYFYFTNPESLAAQYRGKLSVSLIDKEASIVTLTVAGLVPQQEMDYLNALMEVYINYGLENKNGTADSTIKFINKQISIISDSLMNAEARMENFRKRNSFFEISREGTIIQNKFENLENEKTAFELQLQYYNYLSEYLNSKNIDATIISPTVMGITDPILLKLVNDLSEIRTEREKLSFNIEINQPAIQLIEKQNEETRKALMENVTNGIERLNLSIRQTNRKIAAVDTLINMLPTTEKEFINIQRKFDLNNTVYTYLLEKRAESGIAKASNLPDNRIIDYASSSGQVKPKTRKNYMVALIIGLVIPMIVIGIIDYLNDKVIDRKDVEKKTRVPIIGYVSHNEGKTEIPVYEKPSSSIAESFRSIRTALKYFVKGKDVAVIAISSTISSEGKTFISINLASIIAMLGKKVLLVGLDLRKPRINKIFECDNSPGMSSFLIGDCEYKEIIKNTQVNNLFYVPSGLTPPNPAELIETEYMKDFIMKAREEFDYIIIDTPPVAIVTDALLIAEHVDINLFIVRQRYSSISTLELIQQLKNQDELKNIAIVINDISLSGYYGYGMRYGYASGYGYSYGGTYYGRGYYDRYGEKNNARGYYIED